MTRLLLSMAFGAAATMFWLGACQTPAHALPDPVPVDTIARGLVLC